MHSLKKILKKIISLIGYEKEFAICRYFFKLILMNGKCIQENSCELITHLSSGINIISRKYPSSDLNVFYDVLEHRQYQPVVNLMKDTISSRESIKIIDAGANVGYSTLFFKKEFPNSYIMAIEPEASNYSLLERNIKLNKCQNIILLKAGLWKNESYLEVQKNSKDKREWAYYVKEVSHPTELKGFGVLDLMEKYTWEYIDLFKIDIEGGERYLFENEKQARGFLSKTKFIAIEIHDEFNIRDRINNYLADNGFEFFIAGELTIGRNKNNL